jgi:RNA polymerase sigma-70 factor (family 1)
MQLQNPDILVSSQVPIHLGDGDEMVFSGIFEKYYSALCIFAERMVGEDNAKDVIEEMFVRLWDKQIQLAGEEHLKAFLYHTAKNACLNFIKSDLKANKRNTIYAKGLPEVEECYLTEVTRTELIRELHSAIADLPLQCSRIIHMSYVDGLKNAAIADQLGLSVQTVKNQKMRGISLLKKRLPGDQFMLFLLLVHHLS